MLKTVGSILQDHIHSAVSNAINASLENFVSPFLEHAADAMESASDVIERLPSAFLDKAFSKSLDVVTPFERMARSAAGTHPVFQHVCAGFCSMQELMWTLSGRPCPALPYQSWTRAFVVAECMLSQLLLS